MSKIKSWRPGDEKRFCRELELGKEYYYVTQQAWAKDSRLAHTVIFTGHLPFTATPCTAGGYSAATLLRRFGPLYDAPPPGIRNIEDPEPQFPPNARLIDF
ncbi:hypothetical protein ACIQPQ_31320 [Streptomyces sp. NPDC091281]|uniref:hypothetical protein n=1 Tax=Streptomyces sp. NPDC091281 TaxID=3365985 RepID=UPI0037F631E0